MQRHLARLAGPLAPCLRLSSRGLVSAAFPCTAEWQSRLDHAVFDSETGVRDMDKYFMDLDKKFTMDQGVSALDVDIFANKAATESELEHLEELLFKLRRTPHTLHTAASTHHAAVRAMLGGGEEQVNHLVRMLEDRSNYGLFLDRYTAVLLLDRLVEGSLRAQAARAASHLMLQEERWPAAASLGSLACWRWLVVRSEEAWHREEELQEEEEEDPEDVVRVRVKEGPPHFGMVPNNYHDDHFDLTEPEKILGKTMWYLSKEGTDPLSRSLTVLGLTLWGKMEEAVGVELEEVVEEVAEEILKVCDDDSVVRKLNSCTKVKLNVDQELLSRSEASVKEEEMSIMEEQKRLYAEWNESRAGAIDNYAAKLKTKTKLDDIAAKKEELSREEERLFFFDNKLQLDRDKEAKVAAWRKTFPKRGWPGTKGYFGHPKWLKAPGKEMKVARWEKREAKKGPAK